MVSRKKIKLISMVSLVFFIFTLMSSSLVFADEPEVSTLERSVVAGSDDAEEFVGGGNDGKTMTNSSDLEMIHDSGSGYAEDQLVGIRFTDITIPKGATVTNAYIQFTAKTGTGEANLYINAEDIDDAQTFTETGPRGFNIGDRDRTEAQVFWSPAVWNVDGRAGGDERTPDLKGLVQAVIDRDGWKSGNAIAFIISGESGQCRNAYSYEGGASKAPKLFVEYTYVPEPIDETIPRWPDGSEITVSNLGVTTVALEWSGASDDVGITEYKIYQDGESVATVAGDVYKYYAVELDKGTEYTFKVEAGDEDGNWTTDGPEISVTTFDLENIALNKSATASGQLADFSPSKAVDGISFDFTNVWADDPIDGKPCWLQIDLKDRYVIKMIEIDDRHGDSWDWPRKAFEIRVSNDPEFNTYEVLGGIAADGTPMTDDATWVLNVDNEEAYQYVMYAKTIGENPLGHTYVSEIRVFSDITAPQWPDGSELDVSDISSSEVTLEWPALEGNDITGYVIYKDGLLLATVSEEVYTYVITDLIPGAEYTFKVEARNSYGLISTNGPSVTMATLADVTVQTTGMSQVVGTDLESSQLALRMKGLSGSFTVNNEKETEQTLTVTIKNVDPDYVTINEGTMISKGVNSFVFSLDVPAEGSVTVDVEPWYTPNPDDFYFVAWSDNQDGTSAFKNKLLPKVNLINPILSVSAGDVNTGTPGTVGGAGNASEYGYPNDGVKDQDYLNYLSLLENYSGSIFEVPGNHDLARGGWVDKDDSRYGMGEALWKKYLGDINYSFNVGNTHFTMTNFHYDMPDWTRRWGGNINGGYLGLGTSGWQTTLPNDDVGDALYAWLDSDLAAAQDKTNRISVSHHNFSMFIGDGNTVAKARNLYSNRNVNFMISGHQHNYQSGTDSVTGIPYLVIGEAQASNPGFALVHVKGSQITHQRMRADNLNLDVTYNNANDGTEAEGSATIKCSGYDLPFVRLKFKMSNNYEIYEAEDANTGESIPAYSKRFSDYTVVYVETSIDNGSIKDIQINSVGEGLDIGAPEWPDNSDITVSNLTPTGVRLEWPSATDDTAVTVYRIYNGEELIDTIDGDVRFYNVTGLNPNTEYTFRVEAGDAYGHWSEDGPVVTIVTMNLSEQFTVDEPVFTNANGDELDELVPSADLRASIGITNNTKDPGKACFILALYSPDEMTRSVVYVEGWIDPFEKYMFNAGFKLPDDVKGHYVKAFVWDSIEGMQPLSNAVIFQ